MPDTKITLTEKWVEIRKDSNIINKIMLSEDDYRFFDNLTHRYFLLLSQEDYSSFVDIGNIIRDILVKWDAYEVIISNDECIKISIIENTLSPKIYSIIDTPWELITDKNEMHLANNKSKPLYIERQIIGKPSFNNIEMRNGLCVGFMAVDAMEENNSYNYRDEQFLFEEAVSGIKEIDVIVEESGNPEFLHQLSEEHNPDIFYISSYILDNKDTSPHLVLENNIGNKAPICAEELLHQFGDYIPELFFLAANQNHDYSNAKDIISFARKLVSEGANNVISWCGNMSNIDSQSFMHLFYEALSQGKTPNEALSHSRINSFNTDTYNEYIQDKDLTPLMLASLNGYTDVVSYLIKNDADINKCSKSGWTALMLAAGNGHSATVSLLISGGSDIDRMQRDGFTPLMLASINGHLEVIEILITNNANINLTQKDGLTATSLAIQLGYKDVSDYLHKIGGANDINSGERQIGTLNRYWHSTRVYVKKGSEGRLSNPSLNQKSIFSKEPSNDLLHPNNTDYLGRRREIQHALSILTGDKAALSSRALLLHGEAGIGKSSLAMKIASYMPDHQKIIVQQDFSASNIIQSILNGVNNDNYNHLMPNLKKKVGVKLFKKTINSIISDAKLHKPIVLIIDGLDEDRNYYFGGELNDKNKSDSFEVLLSLIQVFNECKSRSYLMITSRYLLDCNNVDADGIFHSSGLMNIKISPLNDIENKILLNRFNKKLSHKIDGRELGGAINKISAAYRNIGDYDRTIDMIQNHEIPIYQKKNDILSEAIANGKIADIYHSRGELDLALKIRLEKEIPVYQKLGDIRSEAIANGQIADIYLARGELDRALKIRLEKEIPVYQKLGDIRSEAIATNQIADIYQAQGDFSRALQIYEGQISVYQKLGDTRSMAITQGKIADIYQMRGEYENALKIRLEEELPVYQKLADAHAEAITKGNIANIYFELGDYNHALEIRIKSELPIYQRLADIKSEAITYIEIANILDATGDTGGALRMLEDKALPAFKKINATHLMAVTIGRIADIHQANNELELALKVRLEDELPLYQKLAEDKSINAVKEKISKLNVLLKKRHS